MPHSEQAALLTIDQQYVAIEACCDELIIASGAPADIPALGQLRMRLAGLLQANLAAEESQVNAPCRRLPVDKRPPQFTDLANEAAQLRARYSEHVRRWSLGTIAADSIGYASDARNLVQGMRYHLIKKRRLLPDWRNALAAHQQQDVRERLMARSAPFSR